MKQVYISEMMLFISNVLRGNPPKCVSMSNRKCKVRPEIINFDSNKPYSVKINKYSVVVIMSMIYAKLCVTDVAKNTNIKVFNLMSRTSETRHIRWHEICKCKCTLHASVCSNK